MLRRVGLAALGAIASACTFTGLGDYEIDTCARPRGTTSTVQAVGMLGAQSDLGFTSASGKDSVAAFTADVTGGRCIEAVGSPGFLSSSCLFLGDELTLVPRQPAVVPIGPGYAATLIATTAPCTAGAPLYRFHAPSVVGAADGECPTSGTALPSITAFSDGATAALAWYATPLESRADPIGACAGAVAAPLMVAIVTDAAGATPQLGTPMDVADTGIAVRPAAMIPGPGPTQVTLAAPLANDVGVWTVSATGDAEMRATIPFAGARAVAIAGNGSSGIAVAAEIGCAPQSIVVAFGTLDGGFPRATVVTQPGSDLAVEPTVAWLDGRKQWAVSWITTAGGAHALARLFDATGKPLADLADPKMKATAAVATSSGGVFGFIAASGNFVDTSLGCTP